VGINPGLWTAATQTHFAHPGNRFYPALLRGGVITEPIDAAAGMTDAQRDVLRPRVVAVAGITAYRTAFGRPKAAMGRQPEPLAGAELWVVPNPSGLNAHETVETLAAAYAEAARAAGIVASPLVE
jgi:TDG/mug DNA glycosylase family protein